MNIIEGATFFGLDLSTQQLKGVIINSKLETLQQAQVQFDTDLPEFGTCGGVVVESDGRTITAPTIMWVKAVDLLMDKLRLMGADFARVAALSGTAQQHGSVYWQTGAGRILRTLQPDKFLHQQLAASFSVANSPVWRDSSSSLQCRQLEAAVGGAQKLAELTGSMAYERFTGPQIAKMYGSKQQAYLATERISLVSSFACSLFLGDYAPIDFADGSGTNLMDIREKCWNKECLAACAPDMASRLGGLVASHTVVGTISSYFVDRFGFSPGCSVVAFTGDNPASLIGMCLMPGDIAVSLGTSDTVFFWLCVPQVLLEGHVLCNPVSEHEYMALLCFKNGSLTRERIRDQFADGSWGKFDELLQRTLPGNSGNMGLYYDAAEILPAAQGDYRIDASGTHMDKFASPETEVRALVEGQFVAKRAHAEELGFTIGPSSRVLATGGASSNSCLLQALSDVFCAPVYTLSTTNSAVLGAAYQALRGVSGIPFSQVAAAAAAPTLACTPASDADKVYTPMLARYRHLVAQISGVFQ